MLRRDRLLSSLLQVVADGIENDVGDGYELLQAVRAWIGEATGQAAAELRRFHVAPAETEGGRVPPAQRATLALEIVKRDGRITSGKLARAAGCHSETARLTLVAMCRTGTLCKMGDRRRTYYRVRAY